MRIGLISPKAPFLSLNPKFNEFWSRSKFTNTYRQNWSGIGSGLLIIASLTPPTYEIEVIDENIDTIDFSRKYDIVGITAMTQQAIRAYQIADEFRKRNVKVVIGGIHATVLPEEAKEHADSVVIGEAEYLWPKLIEDFENDILKFYYKNENTVNLIDSPIPRYDLLRLKQYSVCWIQTTRGCPHDCEFCAASNIYGDKYRNKNIEQVINEIKFIKEKLGFIRIGFGDDNLLADKKKSKEFLEQLIPLNIRWAGQTDISIAEDEYLLKLLTKSGCTFLFIGFESLSEDNLKLVDNKNKWKLNKFKNYKTYIKNIQSYGIGIMGSFIIGLDNDDISVFNKIIDFVIENNLYDVQVSILTPLPGTRLRERMEKEGRLLPTKWDNYTLCDVNFIHDKLSKEEIEHGAYEVYTKVNSQEVYMKKMEYFKEIHKNLIQKGVK